VCSVVREGYKYPGIPLKERQKEGGQHTTGNETRNGEKEKQKNSNREEEND
jgi:hypothetical protein